MGLEDTLTDNYTRRAKLIRVIDGDTVVLSIDLGWASSIEEHVRLHGLDTPEIRGPEREEGLHYKEYVEDWFANNGSVVILESRAFSRSGRVGKDKYGRTLGEIYSLGGESLNERLKAML